MFVKGGIILTILEATTQIVTAMINTNRLSKNESNKIDNETVLKALDDIYKKLEELEQSVPVYVE